MEEAKGDGRVRISAAEWQSKYKSKKENFEFLTVELGAWLSSYDTVTIYFCKDLVSGKKKCKCTSPSNDTCADIKCDKVKVKFAPQYESLSLERIFAKARDWPDVWEYLPDERDLRRLPRQWVISVIYTVVGQPFADWVDERIQARNEKLAFEGNKMIEVDPEIAACFAASTNISGKWFRAQCLCVLPRLVGVNVLVSKGTGAMLLKEKTNRRRSRAEILAAKEQEAERLREEIAHIKEIQELRDKLELKNQEADRHRQASDIINEMIRTGSAKVNEQGQLELI